MRFVFLFSLLPFATIAQKLKSPKTYASTITAADLKKHLYIVAGPEMEGRETATEGERRAAAYISDHFRLLNLTPGNNGNFLMPFPLFRDSSINITLQVNGKNFQHGIDFSSGFSIYNSSLFFSEAVLLDPSIPDSILMRTVYGKLVMSGDYGILHKALLHGAAARLFIDSNFRAQKIDATGYIRQHKFQPAVMPNMFTISKAVADAIIGNTRVENKERVFKADVELTINKQTSQLFSNNVIGIIEGSDKKDEYVLITAHYDHEGKRPDGRIFYGADDDGTGTVSILEMAEAFAKAKAAGQGPRRTMVFMTVSGEEKGLWGSHYYSEHPVFPLEKTTADLNIDMIGRIDPAYKGDSLNYIYTIGENKMSSELPAITDKLNKKYSKLEIDRKFNDPKDPNRFFYRSDHYNFARKGVPIIFYFNGTHADYHKTTDTPDKINYSLMEKRARLIFYTAWELANRNDMLKRDIPLE